MENGKIKLRIESKTENVRLAGTSVNAICHMTGFDPETAYQLELCVVEVLNNCILHAYENSPEGKIDIEVIISQKEMTFVITDRGKSFQNFNELFENSRLDFEPDDLAGLPENGLGLYIIKNIMDRVSYRTSDEKNTMVLTKIRGNKHCQRALPT